MIVEEYCRKYTLENTNIKQKIRNQHYYRIKIDLQILSKALEISYWKNTVQEETRFISGNDLQLQFI